MKRNTVSDAASGHWFQGYSHCPILNGQGSGRVDARIRANAVDGHGATRAGSLETGSGRRLAMLTLLALLTLEIPADLRQRDWRLFVHFALPS